MKKIIVLFLMVIGCGLLLASCAFNEEYSIPERSCLTCGDIGKSSDDTSTAYHKIQAKEAKKIMDAGDVTIIDVRTTEEYADEHIPGAISIPNESIGKEPPAQLTDKDAILLVYCRTGVRSREASDKLVTLGYNQVYDFGGITSWPLKRKADLLIKDIETNDSRNSYERKL